MLIFSHESKSEKYIPYTLWKGLTGNPRDFTTFLEESNKMNGSMNEAGGFGRPFVGNTCHH